MNIRPTDAAPTFVRRAAHQRYAWAAAHVRGGSVLDVGAAEGEGAAPLTGIPGIVYTAVDADPADGSDPIRLPADLHRVDPADTVVAMEVLEHVDPADQYGFLAACWTLTRRRLLLTTPHPDGSRWHPQTDHFIGFGNPSHTREMHPWAIVRYLADACPGGVVTVTPVGLDPDDRFVYAAADLPPAQTCIIVDRPARR